jgi:hypothetical protein
MGRYYHGDIKGKFWQGIQSSDDARHFGGHETELQDEESGVVHELEYFFYMDDIQDINSGIATCIKDLGVYKEKLDELFDEDSYCSKKDLAKNLGVSKDECSALLESYARLQLGYQIKVCVWEKGHCVFIAEL